MKRREATITTKYPLSPGEWCGYYRHPCLVVTQTSVTYIHPYKATGKTISWPRDRTLAGVLADLSRDKNTVATQLMEKVEQQKRSQNPLSGPAECGPLHWTSLQYHPSAAAKPVFTKCWALNGSLFCCQFCHSACLTWRHGSFLCFFLHQ